jgi:hypothetical protein
MTTQYLTLKHAEKNENCITRNLKEFSPEAVFLPVDRYPDFFLMAISENQVTLLTAKFEKVPRQLYIHFTIRDNLVNASLLPPPEGLESIRRLTGTQRFLSQMGQ